MDDSGPDLGALIDEMHREATKLVEQIEEGARHYKGGDLEAVQLVLGLTHYGISHVSTARRGVMEKLDAMGVKEGG